MILGFHRRFHDFVRDGSKQHTIRARGKRRSFRPGDSCDCFGNPRQKSMFLLGRWPCVKVEKIRIALTDSEAVPLQVSIEGILLSPEEADMLFWRDGFRGEGEVSYRSDGKTYPCMVRAAAFWKDSLAQPFIGDLIHWKWSAA